MSSLPYMAQFVVQNIAGFGADFLRKRYGWTDATWLRKAFDCSAHLLPGLCLIGAGYVGCDRTAAVVLLTLSVGLSGLNGGGFLVNHLDVGPPFAGVLFGLSNSLATIPGFAGPALVGVIAKHRTVEEWRDVFFLTAGVYFFSVVFYAIFASGKVQPWAEDPHLEDKGLTDNEELPGQPSSSYPA